MHIHLAIKFRLLHNLKYGSLLRTRTQQGAIRITIVNSFTDKNDRWVFVTAGIWTTDFS